jgi:pyridoxine 5-phosphate synthase
VLLDFPADSERLTELSDTLTAMGGRRIYVLVPERGAKKKLCEMARENARLSHERREAEREVQDMTAVRLASLLALEVVPDEVCLVPERRQELTTEGGLDAAGQLDLLRPTVKALAAQGTHVSLFIAPDRRQLEAAAALEVPYVELHTGAYANATGDELKRELDALHDAAAYGATLGLKVNAGHGLTMTNVKPLLDIPNLDTLNIGHSIIAHALFVGVAQATRDMLAAIAR